MGLTASHKELKCPLTSSLYIKNFIKSLIACEEDLNGMRMKQKANKEIIPRYFPNITK